MKRLLVIVSVLMLSLPIGLLADDYIDDAYYSPQVELSGQSNSRGKNSSPETGEVVRSAGGVDKTSSFSNSHSPYYDKKAMQEFVFEADTTMLPMKQDSIPITK